MAGITLHNWAIFSKNEGVGQQSWCQLLVTVGLSWTPIEPTFVTKEQKIQVHLWTLHKWVHLKRPVGIIRATHERSCKPLEGGQLNKGWGRVGGSKEVRRGRWKEEERKGKWRIIENCCYAAWDSLQSQMGVEESRRAGTWSSWGEGKTPKAKPPCYTILTLGLCLSCLSRLSEPFDQSSFYKARY